MGKLSVLEEKTEAFIAFANEKVLFVTQKVEGMTVASVIYDWCLGRINMSKEDVMKTIFQHRDATDKQFAHIKQKQFTFQKVIGEGDDFEHQSLIEYCMSTIPMHYNKFKHLPNEVNKTGDMIRNLTTKFRDETMFKIPEEFQKTHNMIDRANDLISEQISELSSIK